MGKLTFSDEPTVSQFDFYQDGTLYLCDNDFSKTIDFSEDKGPTPLDKVFNFTKK